MRILMTGANSYLGGRTIPLLRAAGHEVIAVARDGATMAAVDRCGVASYPWDGIPKADVLIHLATFYSGQTMPGEALGIVRSNITAPFELVQRFIDAGGARVVGAGTCWEECGADRHPANLYAASKSAFRTLCRQLCDESGRQLVWLRFTDIVGPDDPRRRLFRIVAESMADKTSLPMTRGEQPFDPVWIDDAAAAVIGAVAVAEGTPVDVSIAGGEPDTLRRKIQPIFDRRGLPLLPQWGARPYRRGEPFVPAWRPTPSWWAARRTYASIVDDLFVP